MHAHLLTALTAVVAISFSTTASAEPDGNLSMPITNVTAQEELSPAETATSTVTPDHEDQASHESLAHFCNFHRRYCLYRWGYDVRGNYWWRFVSPYCRGW